MPQKRNIQSSEPSTAAFGHNSPKKYSIWQNDNRQIWLALALLIAGLVLTCAAALHVKRGVESKAKKEFVFACGEIKNKISTRLRSHALLLRSGSAFFESADEITREAWTNFITRQKIERNLPGIQGIGYAIIIPPDQLALHERKIRNEGFPQYAVKPTGEREIYTSIIYLEPFSKRNQRAFGYDMFSEPIRRKAMEHARDFDEAALSGKIMLVQETDKDIQAGTLMYVPVYEKGQPVRTIEERRRAIQGWVYSPYRMNDLMRGILGAWEFGKGRQIRLEVFDDASFQSKNLLYDSSPGQKLEPTSASIFNEQTSILFNNHSWSLRFTQIGDRTGIVDYSKAWYVLIGGTLLSVLLFILYLLLINAVSRSHTLEEALTRELHESNERKNAEDMLRQQTDAMDSAIDGMAILNKDEEYVYVNKAHIKMYGYENEGEIIGKSWRILYDSYVIQRFEQEFMPEFSRKGYWFGESIGKKKNGSKFPQAISLTAMANGGLICVVRDINERKEAEDKLKESESKYRLLADNVEDVIFVLDMNLKYTYVSPSVKIMRGYEPEEVLKQTPADILTPSSMDLAMKTLSEVMELEKIGHQEIDNSRTLQLEMKRKDGTTVWTEVKFTFIRDENQQPLSIMGITRDITERHKLEQKLQESEKYFKEITENSSDITIILNKKGDIKYCSRSTERFVGYKPEELVDRSVINFIHPDDVKRAVDDFGKAIRIKDSSIPNAFRIIHKDGSERYFEGLGKNLLDNPDVAGFIMNVRDATERKQAEEALRQNEDKYRNILENIQEGYYEVDLAGNLTFFNNSFCRIYGYSKEELTGMNYRQYTDKEQSKELFQAFNKVYGTGEPAEAFDWQVIRKDGTKRYVELSASLQKDSSGKPIGFRGIVRDTTDRKRTEDALRESEEKYRTILKDMDDVYFEVDIKGNITFVNTSSCKMSGYSEEELLGMLFKKISAPDYIEKVMQYFGEIFLTGKTGKPFLLNLVKKSGKQGFFEIVASLIRDKQGEPIGFRGIGRDVTERKQAETKLQQTLDNLRKSFGATIQVMVSAVEIRDPYTAGHQLRVADLARTIATEMGLSQDKIDGIRMAGSIHDIGKLSIPAEILSKPTKLTNIEFSLIKEHSLIGYEMLKDVESQWPLAEIVYQHHERMNGTGYPRHLKGDEILMEARIIAVADVVEAMASHRPYRAALGIDAALEEIEKNKGIFYDNTVADACLKLFQETGYQFT